MILDHHTYLPMKMEMTRGSETSAYEIQMPGNYPEDITLHPKLRESLRAKSISFFLQTSVQQL
jgi:hypothetical protein